LRSGRSFALRHFLRIRASGAATQSQAYTVSSPTATAAPTSSACYQQTTRTRGVVHFEITLPDFSYQCVGVPAIPILATPLSLSLFQQVSTEVDSISAHLDYKPSQGFVSLSQTRKAVLISESDDLALSSMPMVGVWLRLSMSDVMAANQALHEHLSKALLHPLCWAACTRYVCTEKIAQRVNPAQNTFLFVSLICDFDSVFFFFSTTKYVCSLDFVD
jgi:hypothetical protein